MSARVVLLLAACSSSATKPPHEDPRPPPSEPPQPAAGGGDAAAAGKGDVQIRVEWHDVPLEPGGLYELDGAADPAWIAAGASALTDAAGQAVLRDIPSGNHAVLAWLPPRADQPARVARGNVQVTAGALVELTLDLAR